MILSKKINSLVLNLKKNRELLLILLCLTILFGVVGQYLGGLLFFEVAHISLNHLTVHSLFDYHSVYAQNRSIDAWIQLGFVVGALVTLLPIGLTTLYFFSNRDREELHGSARFANDRDLRHSGLFEQEESLYPEILLGRMPTGRYQGQLVKFAGQTFVGVSAPTGSGKGVSIVIPNAVNYRDSLVVFDVKLENFRKSAGFRARSGQSVYLFSPDGFALTPEDRDQVQLRSHRWNPLSYIRRQPAYRVGDILTIAAILYPVTGDKNDIWNELAGKLFKGLVLYMLDHEKEKMPVTFSQLLALSSPDEGLDQWMKTEIGTGVLSRECVLEFNAYLAAPNETKGSIFSNLVSPLTIFSDAICAAATSDDDFDLREVRRKRMSIYIGIQPDNLPKFAKLINLFVSQLIAENTSVLPEDDPTLTYQCLLLLDEFPAMGPVEIIKKSIAYTRGYNIRFLLIFQDHAQLEDRSLYGKEGAKVLFKNLAAEVIFPPKDVDEHTERLAKTLGFKTVKGTNQSVSRGRQMSRSTNISDQRRALMMPHEIKELGFETYKDTGIGLKCLAQMENKRPFIMDKIIYFDDPVFMQRVEFSQTHVPDIPRLNIDQKTTNSSTEPLCEV